MWSFYINYLFNDFKENVLYCETTYVRNAILSITNIHHGLQTKALVQFWPNTPYYKGHNGAVLPILWVHSFLVLPPLVNLDKLATTCLIV